MPVILSQHNAWGSAKVIHSIASKKQGVPQLLIAKDMKSFNLILSDLELFNSSDIKILPFPEYTQEPFDIARVLPEIISKRICTLIELSVLRDYIVIATPYSILKKNPKKTDLLSSILTVKKDLKLTSDELYYYLDLLGYIKVEFVTGEGEFRIRGDIADIFPISSTLPIRIEYFDDDIERLYSFDVDTQARKEDLESIDILPASELLLSTDEFVKRIASPSLREKAETFGKFAGFHWYAPLCSVDQETLFDYLPKNCEIILFDNDSNGEFERFFQTVQDDLAIREYDEKTATKLLSSFLTDKEAIKLVNGYNEKRITDISSGIDSVALEYRGVISRFTYEKTNVYSSLTKAVDIFKELLEDSYKIIISIESDKFNKLLREFIRDYSITLTEIKNLSEVKSSGIYIYRSRVSGGFLDPKNKLAVITDTDIFGFTKHRTKVKKREVFNTTLADLEDGDYIVHVNHGIGIYRGIRHLTIAGVEGDFLDILYDGDDILYVPLHSISMVQKYIGAGDSTPRISSLKTAAWQKLKKYAKQSAKEVAEDLLRLYAERKAKKGFAFKDDGQLLTEFEEAFLYDETEDQLSAILDVYNDMESQIPMERLVCGDVGFGKTEVAMRATCKAVLSGKQVAILVPTTILARQHYDTFKRRFKELPIKIDFVSRFRTAKEIKSIYHNLAEGGLDVIIGTHKLLSKAVVFKDLGLLVVDEEQRFGVNHKERITAIKRDVDTLTLSATPIPRTLQLSLSGIRDMSIIETPPEDRLPVVVSIIKEDEEIKKAILEELKRGGQVFYLHNKVHNILEVMDSVRRLVPNATIDIAHGQMNSMQLEDILQAFYAGQIDILISTTIIENGIDIPNVNTIIINNAGHFGLSQLYQLKGRVGRSKRRGHCYLVVKDFSALNEIAKKRLTIIEQLSDLGSGFKIAMYDLQLRGAGDILGAEQSGFVVKIGYELYVKMIEDAVAELRGGGISYADAEINSQIPYFIPADYIDNPKLRFEYYRRFSTSSSVTDMDMLLKELETIYGELPIEIVSLSYIMLVKNIATMIGAAKVNIASRSAKIIFAGGTTIAFETIENILKTANVKYRFSSEYELNLTIDEGNILTSLSDIFVSIYNKNMITWSYDYAK